MGLLDIWIPVLIVLVVSTPSSCFIAKRSATTTTTTSTPATTAAQGVDSAGDTVAHTVHCPPGSVSTPPQGMDSAGDTVAHTVHCPPGSVFCFQTKQCINLDGSCREPTCDSNSQFPELALCHVDGRLQCTDGSACDHVQVITKLEEDFDSVIGYDMAGHLTFNDHLRQQIADHLGINNNEIWDVNSAGPGDIWITFKTVPRVHGALEDVFVRECNQFLHMADGRVLLMDCSQAYVYRPRTEEYCFKKWCPSGTACRHDQVYCFLTRSCVDVDGSCSCSTAQEACWSTGSKKCVPTGECPFYSAYMQIDADYASIVGGNAPAFSEHIRLSLTALLGVSKMVIPWVGVWPGSVWVHIWTSYPSIQEKIQELVDHHVFPTDMNGNILFVSTIEIDGDDHHQEEVHCEDGQVFCFMRRECVNIHSNGDGTVVVDDGMCGGNEHGPRNGGECSVGQVFCFMRRECVNIHSNGDGTVVVDYGMCGGNEHGPRHGGECSFGQVFCMMRRECVSMHNTADDGHDSENCEYGTQPHDNACPYGKEECWSAGMKECLPLGECNNYSGGDSQNQDEDEVHCGRGQIFCMMRRQCVPIQDNFDSCTDPGVPTYECPSNLEECWSAGIKECVPLGECPNYYGGDNNNKEKDEVHCAEGQIFCMMRRQCVPVQKDNDSCTDPDVLAPECPSILVNCRSNNGVYGCMEPYDCATTMSATFEIYSKHSNATMTLEKGLFVKFLTSSLQILPQHIDGLNISSSTSAGSIEISFRLAIPDVIQMEVTLIRLEHLANNGEIVTIAGHSYITVPGSLALGYSHSTEIPNDDNCSDEGCTCHPGQIYCLMRRTCVTKEKLDDCTNPHHDSECPREQFWCPGATNNDGVCMTKGSRCETRDLGSGDTNGDTGGHADMCSEDGCTCPRGLIFCMKKRQCVPMSTMGSCNITTNGTECPLEQHFCPGANANESTCVPNASPCGNQGSAGDSTKFMQVFLALDADYAVVIGEDSVSMEEYLIQQLVDQMLSITGDNIVGVESGPGSINLMVTIQETDTSLLSMKAEFMEAIFNFTDREGNLLPVIKDSKRTFIITERCLDTNQCTFVCDNMEYCKSSKRCMSREECEQIHEPDVFMGRFVIRAEGNTLRRIVGKHLRKLQSHLMDQLRRRSHVVAIIDLKWLVIIPTQDLDRMAVVVKLETQKNTVTYQSMLSVADLTHQLQDVRLTTMEPDSVPLELIQTPTVVKVSERAPRQVLLIPNAIPSDEEYTFTLKSLLPPHAHNGRAVTNEVTIDCSGTRVQVITSGTNASRVVVGVDEEIGILHQYTTIEIVECQLEHANLTELDADPDSEVYKLGFITIPYSMETPRSELFTPHISLRKTSVVLQESDEKTCHKFDDNLFSVNFAGNGLYEVLDNWPQRMVDTNEFWVGDSIHLKIQQLLLKLDYNRKSAMLFHRAHISVSKDTRRQYNKLVAVLRYGTEILPEDGFETDLFMRRDNVRVCVMPHYSGNFVVEIKQVNNFKNGMRRNIPDANSPLRLTVKVVNTNDAPTLRRGALDILRKHGDFIFPRSPIPEEGDSSYYVAEYTVGDFASHLFHDKMDKDTVLGIAVIGTEIARIGGVWEYFSMTSRAWSSIGTMERAPLTGGQSTTTAILLGRNDKIKFTPDSQYIASNWVRYDSPRLYAAGWDGSNRNETNGAAELNLTRCPNKSLLKEIAPFCIDAGKTSPYSSQILIIPLERKGCDGKIDSGLQVTSECGKCNVYDCRDCNGVNGGGAELDECGICGGSNSVFNCTLPECRAKNTLRCKQEDKATQFVDACSTEGKVFREGCPGCVDGDFDDLCNDCGQNACLDCNGTRDGDSYLNLCQMCISPDTQSNECETIGNIQPAAIYVLTPVNITVDVAPTLANTSIADIQCSLRPVNATTSITEVTVVVREIELYTMTLELTVPADEAADSIGVFYVACSFAGSDEYSTAENNEYLLRYSHPTPTSISSPTQYIDELSQVIITGENIVDTGFVMCIIPHCKGRNKCWYKHLPAERVSLTEVVCDVTKLRAFGVGRLYDIHLILGPIAQVDMTRLPPPVQFSVRHRAPNMTGAKLDGNWCPFLYIEFDSPIAIVSDDDSDEDVTCTAIFHDSTVTNHLQDADCTVLQYSIKIKYDAPVDNGTELILRDGVIKDARTTLDVAEFAAGSIVVADREDHTIDMDLNIYGPDVVGDFDVSFEVRTENIGCLTFDLEWDVDILDEESSDPAISSNIEALRTKLSNMDNRRRAFLPIVVDELLPGKTYEYTLTWTAHQNALKTNSIKKNLTRDDTRTIIVDIIGITDGSEVNPTEMIKIDCNLMAAHIISGDKDPLFAWKLAPRHYSLDNRKKTIIPRNQLVGGQTYSLQCGVTWDTTNASAKLHFTTASYPLSALINSEEKTAMNIPFGDSLILDAGDSLDGITPFDGQYSWICENNLFNADVYGPCIGAGGTTVARDVVSFDFTPSYSRLDQTLSVRWTLIIRKDTRTAVAEINLHYYKSTVVITLPDVIIEQKYRTNYVSDTMRLVTIDAYCDATRYVWSSDISGPGSNFIDVNALTSVQDGELVSDTYEPCGVTFDFTDVTLTSADVFIVKLEAIRESGDTILNKPATVEIQVLSKPVTGDILVNIKEAEIMAHSTEVKIILSDWRDDTDGTDLMCNMYYIETGKSEPIKINKRKMEYNLPLTATLPEGNIRIVAKCRNRMGVWSELGYSSENLTVVPMQNFTKALSILGLLIKTDAPGTFAIVRELLKMVVANEDFGVPGSPTIPDMTDEEKAVIREKANEEALNLLPADPTIDPEETFEAMDTTIDIFGKDKDNIAPETKLKMQKTAEDVTKMKTGATTVSTNNRKKRSTEITYSDGVGLSETDATTVLQTFGMTIADEFSLTKDVAVSLITMIDLVMVGLCQNGTKSPMKAVTGLVTLRLERRTLYGISSSDMDIACSDCPAHVPYPAMVQYGAYLEEKYSGAWDCISDKPYGCTDVCVASAQLSVDAVTPTATDELSDPGRRSDLVVTKMVNPNSYATEIETNLTTPAVFTLQTDSDVDMDIYDLKCKMWVAEVWSDFECVTGIPTQDNATSTYTVTCSCTALGILGIFQDMKPVEITTMSTTSTELTPSTTTPLVTTTTTVPATTTIRATTTTSPTATTVPPAKDLPSDTVSIKCTFKLDEDYNTQMASTSPTAMHSRIKQDLIVATGYSGNSFKNLSIRPGSIIVNFDLVATGLPADTTLGQMVYKIEQLVQTGSLIVHNPDGGVMAVMTDTFMFVAQSSSEDDKHGGDQHDAGHRKPAYIVAGIMGCLLIIGVFVVLGIMAVKYSKRQTTVNDVAQPATPSHGYAPPATIPLGMHQGIPPPPYGYQPPAADQLYPGTTNSGLNEHRDDTSNSTERHQKQKDDSHQPTPVDT